MLEGLSLRNTKLLHAPVVCLETFHVVLMLDLGLSDHLTFDYSDRMIFIVVACLPHRDDRSKDEKMLIDSFLYV